MQDTAERRRSDRMAIAVAALIVAGAVVAFGVGRVKEPPAQQVVPLKIAVVVPSRDSSRSAEASAVFDAVRLAVQDNKDTLTSVYVSVNVVRVDAEDSESGIQSAAKHASEDTAVVAIAAVAPLSASRIIAPGLTGTVPAVVPAPLSTAAFPDGPELLARLHRLDGGGFDERFAGGAYDGGTALVNAIIVAARARGNAGVASADGRGVIAGALLHTDFEGITGRVRFPSVASGVPFAWRQSGDGTWSPLR